MTDKGIRAIFRQENIQLSPKALKIIQGDFKKRVENMAKRCKKGNIKRLKEDDLWIAYGGF